jgi:hypothetical protein
MCLVNRILIPILPFHRLNKSKGKMQRAKVEIPKTTFVVPARGFAFGRLHFVF